MNELTDFLFCLREMKATIEFTVNDQMLSQQLVNHWVAVLQGYAFILQMVIDLCRIRRGNYRWVEFKCIQILLKPVHTCHNIVSLPLAFY